MSFAKEAFKQLFRKAATREYPFEKVSLPPGFRGRPIWDLKKCIGCGLCQSTCPTAAIELVGKGVTAEIKYHLDRCVFCAQCEEICPRAAITMSNEFELAGFDRSSMLYWYKREAQSKATAQQRKTVS